MPSAPLPVAALAIQEDAKDLGSPGRSEPVYGGYANGRGDVTLFAKDLAYGVHLKNRTLRPRPQLNSGAQARYDATAAGESFQYGNKTFHRLSPEQIAEICTSGRFRISPRQF